MLRAGIDGTLVAVNMLFAAYLLVVAPADYFYGDEGAIFACLLAVLPTAFLGGVIAARILVRSGARNPLAFLPTTPALYGIAAVLIIRAASDGVMRGAASWAVDLALPLSVFLGTSVAGTLVGWGWRAWPNKAAPGNGGPQASTLAPAAPDPRRSA